MEQEQIRQELDELLGKLAHAAVKAKSIHEYGLSANQAYFCYIQAMSIFREHYGAEGMELFWIMMPDPDPGFCWEERNAVR